RPHDPRVPRGSAERAGAGSRVSAPRRRVHRRSRSDVDYLQTRKGTRPDPAETTSARVLFVLRQLNADLSVSVQDSIQTTREIRRAPSPSLPRFQRPLRETRAP